MATYANTVITRVPRTIIKSRLANGNLFAVDRNRKIGRYPSVSPHLLAEETALPLRFRNERRIFPFHYERGDEIRPARNTSMSALQRTPQFRRFSEDPQTTNTNSASDSLATGTAPATPTEFSEAADSASEPTEAQEPKAPEAPAAEAPAAPAPEAPAPEAPAEGAPTGE